MRGLTAFVLIAAGGLAAAVTAGAQPLTDSRVNAYDEFRALFAAGRYADALPYAERVVDQLDPGDVGSPDLPQALNNLAATQFRLGNIDDAEASYWKSLGLLQLSQGISSPNLIEPLAGLAAIFAEQNRLASATEFYRHAVDVSRRAHGLFNLAQLDLLDGLSAIYLGAGDYAAVEQIRRYAVEIAEQNYGANDPRVAPALLRLALWYESRRDYVTARAAYTRIAELTPKVSEDHTAMTIEGLLGIGRTYRLQFTLDPESLLNPSSPVKQVTINPVALSQVGRPFWWLQGEAAKFAREGYRTLQSALELLDGLEGSAVSLRVRTLLELGDWFTASRQPNTALSYYSRAATALEQAPSSNGPSPLAAPRLVVYRPPLAAIRNRDLPPRQTIARPAHFVLTVTEKGKPREVGIASGEMTEMQAIQVRRALEQAIYSPRFEHGRPARTVGVEFTDYWFDLAPTSRPDAKPPSTGG